MEVHALLSVAHPKAHDDHEGVRYPLLRRLSEELHVASELLREHFILQEALDAGGLPLPLPF
jgi:hypothetical protein